MYGIWINTEGYYTEEHNNDTVTVEVEEMPKDLKNAHDLCAYRYDESTKLLELDETKLAELQEVRAKKVKIPSESERLADLEAAFLELSSMILGGDTNG